MKESIFSFFNAPITNQVPNGVVCVSQLYAYITTSEWLRERTDQVRAASSDEKRFRRLKQSLLPYVTPAGIFSYRTEDHLLVPSGEFVIDIDHLSSPEEAICWRDTLFADERLRPDLSFVSPSTTGIKLLVPYRLASVSPPHTGKKSCQLKLSDTRIHRLFEQRTLNHNLLLKRNKYHYQLRQPTIPSL